MAEPYSLMTTDARGEWVRLRTLASLRWMAILGQITAVLVARYRLGLDFQIGLCFAGIGALVIANLVAVAVYPRSRRLHERETLLTLVFDIAQLSFMLYATGGLNNPFALLIVAPVTISATALTLGSTALLATLAVGAVTFLAFFNQPLRTASGALLELPPLLLAGFWAALVVGILFLAAFTRRVTVEVYGMSQALLATQMALAREQKLTDIGGIVAATAHELGTPLATIKLVSKELTDELADRPELLEDARLISEQADRCRDILRSMGRLGKDDTMMHRAPLAAIVREAAEPHANRGVAIHYDIAPAEDAPNSPQPEIRRSPEIIHGLRNLIQNAVDFAKDNVWVDIEWSDEQVVVRIIDDGKGFPPDMIDRIGDPFVRRRSGPREDRPEYEGMGLGLFIAKTLLERTGATLGFANGSDPFLAQEETPVRCGAIVEVRWPRALIEARPEDGPLSAENPPMAV
ncbi:MAG: sensor histidine kinase [Alphaproteobacteria bacterium]|nr:MAG: sensor histidine kinase [Alphaproteobacteria bacterium]